MSEVEHFMPILMEKEEEGTLSPILAHGGVRFMWIKHNNLYRILCAADRSLSESQDSLGQRDLKDHPVPTLLPQPGLPTTKSGSRSDCPFYNAFKNTFIKFFSSHNDFECVFLNILH